MYVYPSQAVKQAIRDNASAVVIAHNHPCGSEKPSVADISFSAKLYGAFKAVDIIFHDSVVIAGKKCFSIANKYDLDLVYRNLPEEEMI